MREYYELLRTYPHYRNLWLARTVSLLGDWFNLLASAQLIASLTDSGTAVSGLFLARFLPVFLATPYAGVLADRLNRRNIMLAADLARAATVLGFLFVRSAEQIWLFYALTALQFTLSALYNPAHSAVIANVVPTQKLVPANTLDGLTWSVMLAIGALLGGVAAHLLGVQTAFVLDSVSFLVSAWFVRKIQLVYTTAALTEAETAAEATTAAAASAGPEETRGGLGEFLHGLSYLRLRPFVLALALVKAGGSLVWGAINVLEIPVANDIFPIGGSGTLTLGLIFGLVGVGTGVGPLLLRLWTKGSPVAMLRSVGIGFVLLSLGAIGFGFAPTLPVALAAITLRAIGSGVLWVFSAALLQSMVHDEVRGRVFAFEFTVLTLAESLGTLYGGLAQDRLGLLPQPAMVTAGVFGLIVTGVWLLIQEQSVRRGRLERALQETLPSPLPPAA